MATVWPPKVGQIKLPMAASVLAAPPARQNETYGTTMTKPSAANPEIVVGLDLGSTKVTAVVGEVDGDRPAADCARA